MLEFLHDLGRTGWIAAFALIVSIISLFVTWRFAAEDRRIESNREVLNHLILSLERSYNALSTNEMPQARLCLLGNTGIFANTYLAHLGIFMGGPNITHNQPNQPTAKTGAALGWRWAEVSHRHAI